MDLGLGGKVVAVTGGSRGIGRAVAEAFAREGAQVAICARRIEDLQRASKEIRAATQRSVLAIPADTGDRGQIDFFVERVAGELGGLDVLVNNAGATSFGFFDEITDEQWEADLRVKFLGYVRCARSALPHLRARGGGRIINIAGNAGRQPLPYHLPGGAANAAILNFTKALSLQVERDGIVVLALAPGPVLTERLERQVASQTRAGLLSSVDPMRAFQGRLPFGRAATVDEIAGWAVFLASGRAAYATGTCVTVDGGITAGM